MKVKPWLPEKKEPKKTPLPYCTPGSDLLKPFHFNTTFSIFLKGNTSKDLIKNNGKNLFRVFM